MKLRVKKKYLGRTVVKGLSKFKLTADLTEAELKYVQTSLSPEYVEEFTPKEVKPAKGKNQEKKEDK